MFRIIKKINVSVPALITIVIISYGIISCEESDSEKEWGIALIYMPQSSLQSGGLDNFYYVPTGSNEWNKNYTINNNNINIVLGVYRSGLQALDGYSVSIVTEPETVNQLITDNTLTNAVLLPDDTYSIPTSITVPSGEREAVFYLTIDRNVLLNNYPSYIDMNLILAVSITNPTKYELNPALSTTIVVVDEIWDTLVE